MDNGCLVVVAWFDYDTGDTSSLEIFLKKRLNLTVDVRIATIDRKLMEMIAMILNKLPKIKRIHRNSDYIRALDPQRIGYFVVDDDEMRV